MLPFDFHCPTRTIFGPGRIKELGELVAQLGARRAMVVSDPGIIQAGHTQRGVNHLLAAGLETLVFDGVQENPTTDNVDAGVAVAKDYRPDVIVAIGGGSSMDCAKGINFVYSCGGRMQNYWGVGKATADMLPMAAVPTTSGTGSEAQSFALISDAETHAKMACGDKRAAFRLAILDPELTLTQPQRITSLTGMDAISHAVESFVTKKRNLMSRVFSHEAWELMAGAFEFVVNPDLEAEVGADVWLKFRSRMQSGAFLAGMAIENSMLGAAHALANPLTANYGIAHGEAIGLMLPHVVRHNANDFDTAMAYMELVGPFCEGPYEEPGEQLAQLLIGMRDKAGLAATLSQLEVDHAKLPELATQAATQWTGNFNPVAMTADDYRTLYEAAF